MATQTVKKKRTLIKFGVPQAVYTSGQGTTAVNYVFITAVIGTDENNENITTDCFYCEWRNSYGTQAIQQQADGIIAPARVRLPFVQAVYDALQQKQVRIYKNGLTDAEHTFVLNSTPDNYNEENKMLEFQVKKQGVK